MTEQRENFLVRRKSREASKALTQQLVLGFGIGLILLAFGAYKYFVSIGVWDTLWYAAMVAGAVLIALTWIAPFLWRGLESGIRAFGNFVGHGVMTVILTLFYFLLIWPVGAFLRATKGQHPIYTWQGVPSANMEGWSDKKLPYDLSTSTANSRRTGILKVLVFFVRSGRVIFLPVLLLLVSLGIALFFLKTSALAPFIYTLF